MATMTQTTKQRKPRKTPQPVNGNARWIGGIPTRERLNDGDAILQITVTGKEPSFYFVEVNRDGAKIVGYRLIKLDSLDKTATYDVNAETWQCDCPDATHTDRPGGCKHARALQAALAVVNGQ